MVISLKKTLKKFTAGFLSLTMLAVGCPVNFSISMAKNAETESKTYPLTTEEGKERVNLIVELKEAPLVEQEAFLNSGLESGEEVLKSDAVSEEREAMLSEHEVIRDEIENQVNDSDFEDGFDYTAVFNGFSMETTRSEIQKIMAMPQVKSVREVQAYDVPEIETTKQVVEQTEQILHDVQSTGLTGNGVLISVIDTGIFENHEAFSENSFFTPADKRTDKYSSVDDLKNAIQGQKLSSGVTNLNRTYVNRKIVYSYDYADEKIDGQCFADNHGAHVAGIAAGFCRDEDGTILFQGIAPDAQLISMKVESDNSGKMYDDAIVAALEDSFLLGADVINMSLGDKSGFEKSIYSSIFDKLEKAGTIVCVAAGNDSNASSSLLPSGLPNVENQDYGTLSEQASNVASFAVASGEQGVYYQEGTLKIKNSSEMIPFYETTDRMWNKVLKDKENISYVCFNPGKLEEEDRENLDVEGKVVIIDKSVNELFLDQVYSVENSNAAAILVLNDTDEMLDFQADYFGIPFVFVSKTDGQKILSAMENGEGIIEKAEMSAEKKVVERSELSGFTSWGPTNGLKMGASLTGIGSSVYSVTGCTKNENGENVSEYGFMSGTSMATPMVSGYCAVLLQYLREHSDKKQSLEEYQKRKNNAPDTDAQQDEVIKGLLMCSSIPIETDGVEDPVCIQGSGKINFFNLLASQAIIWTEGTEGSEILLGAKEDTGEDVTFDLKFSIKNYSDEEKNYTINLSTLADKPQYYDNTYTEEEEWGEGEEEGDVAVGSIGSGVDDKNASNLKTEFKESGEQSDFDYYEEATGNGYYVSSGKSEKLLPEDGVRYQFLSGDTITLGANEEKDCQIQLTLSKELIEKRKEIFTNGFLVYGFISLNGSQDERLTVPYLGFVGDWEGFDAVADFKNTETGEEYSIGSTIGYMAEDYTDCPYVPFEKGKIIFNADMLKNVARLNGESEEMIDETPKIGISSSIVLKRNLENIHYEIKNEKGQIITSYVGGTGSNIKTLTNEDDRHIFDNGGHLGIDLGVYYASYLENEDRWFNEVNVNDIAKNQLTGKAFKYEDLEEGNYKYIVAGNLENGSKTLYKECDFYVDKTAPKIQSVGIEEKNGTYTLMIHANDNGKMDKIRIFTEDQTGACSLFTNYGFDEAWMEDGNYAVDITNAIESLKNENQSRESKWKTDRLYIELSDSVGLLSARKQVQITNPALKISKTKVNLYAGEYDQLTTNVSEIEKSSLSFKSSNTNVAEVDKNGKIYAKSAGTAEITVSYGSSQQKCKVTVLKQKMMLNCNTLELMTKGSKRKGKLYLTSLASRNKIKSIKVINGKEHIKISGKKLYGTGKKNAITVTAKSVGTAKVEFSTGSMSVTCKIRVKQPVYQVSYYSDGKKIKTITRKYGKKAKKIAAPKKEGKKFIGWYLNGKKYSFNKKLKGNINLVARYQ